MGRTPSLAVKFGVWVTEFNPPLVPVNAGTQVTRGGVAGRSI